MRSLTHWPVRSDRATGVYWGAAAICQRLGWSPRSAGKLPHLIKKYGVPAFLRVDPHNKFKRTYYSSESMLAAWELASAQLYRRSYRTNRTSSGGRRDGAQATMSDGATRGDTEP